MLAVSQYSTVYELLQGLYVLMYTAGHQRNDGNGVNGVDQDDGGLPLVVNNVLAEQLQEQSTSGANIGMYGCFHLPSLIGLTWPLPFLLTSVLVHVELLGNSRSEG